VDGVVAWRIRDERGLCAWLSEQRDYYLHAASREVGSAPDELAGLREQLATIYAVRVLAIKLQIVLAHTARLPCCWPMSRRRISTPRRSSEQYEPLLSVHF